MARIEGTGGNKAIRSLPPWLAPIVQRLELEGRVIVRFKDIQQARPDLSPAVARRAATELVRRGWLRPLGFRGMYEFIPGAAAGAYPSADPWIPFRAWLASDGHDIHVGGNSAAWLWGYLERSPQRHILVTSKKKLSPVLSNMYRVLRTEPAPGSTAIAGLPVPTPDELFVEVAQLAPRLPLDGAGEWLPRLTGDIRPSKVMALLAGRGPATVARAGFMAEIAQADESADLISSFTDLRGGPYYTGRRQAGAKFHSRWRVYDSGHLA